MERTKSERVRFNGLLNQWFKYDIIPSSIVVEKAPDVENENNSADGLSLPTNGFFYSVDETPETAGESLLDGAKKLPTPICLEDANLLKRLSVRIMNSKRARYDPLGERKRSEREIEKAIQQSNHQNQSKNDDVPTTSSSQEFHKTAKQFFRDLAHKVCALGEGNAPGKADQFSTNVWDEISGDAKKRFYAEKEEDCRQKDIKDQKRILKGKEKYQEYLKTLETNWQDRDPNKKGQVEKTSVIPLSMALRKMVNSIEREKVWINLSHQRNGIRLQDSSPNSFSENFLGLFDYFNSSVPMSLKHHGMTAFESTKSLGMYPATDECFFSGYVEFTGIGKATNEKSWDDNTLHFQGTTLWGMVHSFRSVRRKYPLNVDITKKNYDELETKIQIRDSTGYSMSSVTNSKNGQMAWTDEAVKVNQQVTQASKVVTPIGEETFANGARARQADKVNVVTPFGGTIMSYFGEKGRR